MKYQLTQIGFILASLAIIAADLPPDRVNAPVLLIGTNAQPLWPGINQWPTNGFIFATNTGAISSATNDASGLTNEARNIHWSLCWSNGNHFPCEVSGIDYDLGKITHHLEVVSNRTNHIKRIAASGEICSVLGHSLEGHMHYTLEYVEGRLGCRQCRFCKAHQGKFADWK